MSPRPVRSGVHHCRALHERIHPGYAVASHYLTHEVRGIRQRGAAAPQGMHSQLRYGKIVLELQDTNEP